MKILGIDPGTTRLGYGIIEAQNSKLKVQSYGIIGYQAGTPPERLKAIYIGLTKLIKKHQPDRIGIEQLFFYKNQKTAMRVSQAHGVAMLTASLAGVPVAEFTPAQVKQAVSGYGAADKGQVQRAIKMVLKLKEIPKPDDAADALAVAITAAITQ
ncbi:crossover junction endodeoxyribonuclease RuvC [Candidatus Berkelbacteria bacterium]|nr:crossover junction endodeoxyribonuclease RuvC [Candidatus Berkelbacteria bacterium]